MKPLHLGLTRPIGARGFLPLVLGALGVGKALVGAIQGNQAKQRNKGFIDQNFRAASARMAQQQGVVRASTTDNLNARGLGRIGAAMRSGTAPTTIGEQVAANNEEQFGLERQDLTNQRTEAQANNKAAYNNSLINAGVGAVASGVQAYGAVQDAAAFRTPTGSPSPVASAGPATRFASAMASGSPVDPMIGFAGVHALDPLGHPQSAWYEGGRTLNGGGMANADFNVGNA